MKRLLVVLGTVALTVAATIATALPGHARAGFWATTELDPLPSPLRPDVSYTVGYWVLQHGTHPFDLPGKELGATGLRLTGDGGKTLVFTGTPLPEPAHYAVSIKVPAGRWRVEGLQGIFSPYYVGMLTVPGGLTPAPPQFALGDGPVEDYWGEIKPPGFPWKSKTVVPAIGLSTAPLASGTPSATASPGRTAAATAPEEDAAPWREPYALLVVAVAAIAGTLLVQRLTAATRARRRRTAGPDDGGGAGPAGPPAGPAEVLVIGRDDRTA